MIGTVTAVDYQEGKIEIEVDPERMKQECCGLARLGAGDSLALARFDVEAIVEERVEALVRGRKA